jgi:hypothetical protein
MKKILIAISLLFLVSWSSYAQASPCNTFVKQIHQVGNIEPKIFKAPNASDYYITTFDSHATYITKMDATGNLLSTHQLNFNGDTGTITDIIVDNFDGTLAGIVKGSNYNIMFKYDFNASSFQWLKQYPPDYIFHNIHQTNINTYVVTGNIWLGQTTIFDVDRNTGMIATFQNMSLGGEFFSAWDGNNIYGACRYYFNTNSLFLPSLFKFDTAGNNIWRNTYIINPNTATTPARIYPVAPIVDGADLLQLSSGDDVGFNTYPTGPTKTWLLKTDLNGRLAWTHQINIPGYGQLNAKKIINTATGYYLLIDSYNGSIVDYFFVVKTDKNGVVQWTNRYGISGVNSVISGVESNGFLYLTALSGSYVSGSNTLLLKLDAQGITDADCGYIQKAEAFATPYANIEDARPTSTNPTAYSNSNLGATVANVKADEKIFCCGASTTQLCETLTGSLSNGVLAFYPFGNGSLADLSGNSNNLSNPTGAFPTPDRNNNPRCAYRFSNTDFLTTTAATFLNGLTTSPFSISLWYQPIGTRPGGSYELLMGRGTTGLHCPDTWGEWSVGLYDCRKAVVGFDQDRHWQASPTGMGCVADMAAISNTWHHLAFVYNGSSYDLYINGTLYSSGSSIGSCGSMSANIGPLMLGVDYNGDLDDIVIYNRAISAAEVGALRGLNGSCCDGVTSFNKTSNNSNAQSVLSKRSDNASGITIYPNPSDGKVSISASSNIHSVTVYSATGSLIGTYTFNAKEVFLNIEHLASGFYYLKVVTEAGSSVEKLIKN